MNMAGLRARHERELIEKAAERAMLHFSTSPGITFRVTTKVWKHMLLRGMDTLFSNGVRIQLKAKSLGAGVYELNSIPA